MRSTLIRKSSTIRRATGNGMAPMPLAFAIPADAHTLDGFRRWSLSERFPDQGDITFLSGEVWVDMSPERIEPHNDVKTELNRVLANLAISDDLGKFQADRVRLVNVDADLSCEPDGLFALWATYEEGKLRKQPAKDGKASVELVGTPDWVTEIVSPSSEEKDTKLLLEKYFQAGIAEYWLIDARDKFRFVVYQRASGGYKAATPKGGWIPSKVFQRSFRWRRKKNRIGEIQYRLEAK